MSSSDRSRGPDPGWHRMIALIVAVVVLALVFVVAGLWLITSFNGRPLIVVLGVGALYVAIVAFLFGRVLAAFRRRSAYLDTVIAPLGLTGEVHQTLYRRYRGVFRGRSVVITFSRGPILEIAVATLLQTRLSIRRHPHADAQRFADLTYVPLNLDDPTLAELTVVAEDAGWARRLMAQPGIPRRLGRLLVVAPTAFARCRVDLLPGSAQLALIGVRTPFLLNTPGGLLGLTSDQVRAWLDDLFALITTAEPLSPPPRTAPATVTAHTLDQPRSSSRYLVVWAAVIGAVFLALVAVILVAILVVLGQNS